MKRLCERKNAQITKTNKIKTEEKERKIKEGTIIFSKVKERKKEIFFYNQLKQITKFNQRQKKQYYKYIESNFNYLKEQLLETNY